MIGGAMSNQDKTKYIVILMYSIIIVGIFMYISTKYYEKSTRCGSMEKNYKDANFHVRTDGNSDDYQPWLINLRCNNGLKVGTKKYNNNCYIDGNVSAGIQEDNNIEHVEYVPACLLNYNIKTAYNCCAVNTFKNSWVGECALKHCISAGARCLDFEIYSMNNNPVIGFSSRENNLNIKESFNKIDLFKALNIINNYAFTAEISDECKNFPVIIHLRLKTKNVKVYDKIAKMLYQSFGDKLLDPKYSYRNDKTRETLHSTDNKWTHNLEGISNYDSKIPLICRNLNNTDSSDDPNANNDFYNKVIVIVNVTSILPGKSEKETGIEFEQICKQGGRDGILLDYMNLLSPSPFCSHLRDFEVQNASQSERERIKTESRYKLIFTSPTVGNSSKNVDFELHRKSGAQMIGMCFQNYIKDRPESLSQITQYHNYFKEKGMYARKSLSDSFTYKILADPDPNENSVMTAPKTTN